MDKIGLRALSRGLLALLLSLWSLAAGAEGSGVWVLKSITYGRPQISANPCYPGRSADLSDGSAVFSQGYADCSGEGRVKGGERSQTTIRWQFSGGTARLSPDAPLVAHVTIARQSSPVPYHGGGAAYFYFRTQSAAGGLELKGFLDNPALAKTAERDIRVDRVPRGRDGEKLTMWMNVSGESGIGDVFYNYEFSEAASAAPSAPTAAKDPADPRCGRYGLSAVQQAQENIARGCGFSGPRWSSAYLDHFAWCEAAGVVESDMTRETEARASALARCRPGTVAPPPPPPPPPPEPVRKDSGARFSSMTGEVEVRHDGDPDDMAHWHFAKLNTVLYVGDHIRTREDSSAIISFADLSTYLEKEESEIVVLTPPEKDSKLGLVAGNIMVNLKKMWKDGTMEIEMSQAVAGGKGTVFSLESSRDGVNVATLYEGALELKAKANGAKLLLRAGQRVRIDRRGFAPVETFDAAREMAPWRKRFAGPDMQEIERKIAAAIPVAASPVAPKDAAGRPPSSDTPYGYWAVSKGADGVKVGVVFPDYSPTEFTGAVFFCTPGSGIRGVVDSPGAMAAGARVAVSIRAGDVLARYKGKVSDKTTEDGSVVEFNTAHSDPIFEALAGSDSFEIGVNGAPAKLPAGNARAAFRKFFEDCRQ